MADNDTAVSGPTPGNAGGKNAEDSLDAAFDAAFESIDIGDDAFPAEAKPAKAKTTSKPVDKPAPEDAAPAEPGDEDEPPAEEPEAPETPPTEPAVSAPAHWDAAKREAFGKLDPEARKVVLDLAKGFEADHTRKSMELAEDRKFSQGVRSLISDSHREQLRRSGLDEISGFKRLIELNDFATRDGPGYARWVVQQMGVDPRQIFPELAGDGTGQPYQPPAVDPQFQQLSGTIQNLQTKLQNFERQQADTQYRTADRAIAQFRDMKDEAGQLTHPHFDKVGNAMNWILTSNPEVLAIDDYGQRLEKAYDLAVFADPEIKSQVFEGEVAKRQAEAARVADLARAKKARAPVKAAPLGTPSSKPKTLDEAMKQSAVQLGV